MAFGELNPCVSPRVQPPLPPCIPEFCPLKGGVGGKKKESGGRGQNGPKEWVGKMGGKVLGG